MFLNRVFRLIRWSSRKICFRVSKLLTAQAEKNWHGMFAKILQVSTDEQMGKYSYCSKLVEFKTQNLLRDKRGTAKYLDITIHAKFWESTRCIMVYMKIVNNGKGKYTVTLINRSYLILPRIQHKVVLLILRTVFAVGFWLLNFLLLKLWARIPLQIGDSPSAVFLYFCVNFHKCVSVAF